MRIKRNTIILCGRNARILNVANKVATMGEGTEYTRKLAP